MKTVPTLCATATLVGASAVGLSFARECPPDAPSNNKRKATAARDQDPESMPVPLQPSADATITTKTAHSYRVPSPLTAPLRVPLATHITHNGREQRRIKRRMTSAEPSSVPVVHAGLLNAYVVGRGEADVEDREPVASSRRPQSWIKRLSVISNSQPSSRDTSPGPLSPSISMSNGSMAFSHDGSTAPIIRHRPPPPLPPNKLVKRSLSVQTTRAATSHGTGSRLPSFRRPATSHQRSATLQHQSALLEMTAEHPSSDENHHFPHRSSDSVVEYTPYFTAKVTAESTTLPKRRSSNAVKSLKRFYADAKGKPTLVLASSVSPDANTDEIDDSSENGESLYFMSRPDTPLSITAAVVTQTTDAPPPPPPNAHQNNDITTGDNSNLNPNPSPDDDDDGHGHGDNAVRPRRSFSITDFLSSSSHTKRQRSVKLPLANLARRSTRKRTSSAPMVPTMSTAKRQSNTAHGDPSAATARRDLSDPAPGRRQISTSAGLPSAENARHGLFGASSSSPLPALPPPIPGIAERNPTSMRPGHVQPSAPATANQTPPSPILAHSTGRPSRHSMAASEQASTLVGSDNEARGMGTGDEDDADGDLQSETAFDSLRTGATRSTSGARGPRIETIFDESPPSKTKVTALRDLLPRGTFREQTADAAPGHHSIEEEDESISTPVRTIGPDRSLHESPSLGRGLNAPLFPTLLPSSPPDMPPTLSLGTLEWDSRPGDEDSSSRWSVYDDDDDADSWGELPTNQSMAPLTRPAALGRQKPRLLASGPTPGTATPPAPQHLTLEHGDRDARSSIFDWSEQQHTDKSAGNRTPPRPSTVHGKKDADRRGARSVGRRVPSGLHARSQSVPVVPDATGKRSTVVTNKFGTWGVGSKGVTEDWNDDFDFSDLGDESHAGGATESHRVDSGTVMFVPKTIQEQQSNVLANIGLLREWGLLIEELKEQRVRAAALGILDGPNSGTWEEVDAMIDLADQEAEHDGIPRLSPPSSPAFDEDAFDDVLTSSPSHILDVRKSASPSEDLGRNKNGNGMHPASQPKRTRRKSILRSRHEIFGPQSSPIPLKAKYESPSATRPKPIVTRPRKNSEAKARSVIEALQRRKSTPDPLADIQNAESGKKVPFDTATLRRIVPYVGSLTRKVKDALREAEGLYSSPSTSPSKENEPPFNKMFQSDNDLSTQMKLMTVM